MTALLIKDMGLTEQNATDQRDNATSNVPRLEVIESRNQMSAGEGHSRQAEDKWQKTHRCHDCVVTSRELEV